MWEESFAFHICIGCFSLFLGRPFAMASVLQFQFCSNRIGLGSSVLNAVVFGYTRAALDGKGPILP